MFSFMVDQEVTLRLLIKEDAEEIFALVDQSRGHLRRWMPWVDEVKGPEVYHTLLPQWLYEFAEGKSLNVGMVYQDRLVGVIGFHAFDYINQVTSIGYWLAEDYQGKGIVTRAARQMVELAFQQYGMNRVEIRCAVGNQRSRAVPERLGFRQEGILREVERVGKDYLDHVVYGMTRSQWEKKKTI